MSVKSPQVFIQFSCFLELPVWLLYIYCYYRQRGEILEEVASWSLFIIDNFERKNSFMEWVMKKMGSLKLRYLVPPFIHLQALCYPHHLSIMRYAPPNHYAIGVTPPLCNMGSPLHYAMCVIPPLFDMCHCSIMWLCHPSIMWYASPLNYAIIVIPPLCDMCHRSIIWYASPLHYAICVTPLLCSFQCGSSVTLNPHFLMIKLIYPLFNGLSHIGNTNNNLILLVWNMKKIYTKKSPVFYPFSHHVVAN